MRQSKAFPDIWYNKYESRFILFCVIYMLTHFKPSVWMSDVVIIDTIDADIVSNN